MSIFKTNSFEILHAKLKSIMFNKKPEETQLSSFDNFFPSNSEYWIIFLLASKQPQKSWECCRMSVCQKLKSH